MNQENGYPGGGIGLAGLSVIFPIDEVEDFVAHRLLVDDIPDRVIFRRALRLALPLLLSLALALLQRRASRAERRLGGRRVDVLLRGGGLLLRACGLHLKTGAGMERPWSETEYKSKVRLGWRREWGEGKMKETQVCEGTRWFVSIRL